MKHKHHKEIIAWANGARIEYFSTYENKWDLCVNNNPGWVLNTEYRVAHTSKPDVSRKVHFHVFSKIVTVEITFDGETGKLKSAELIS